MTTPKTGLTETANGQANYLNVNAALNALDQLVQQRVVDKDLTSPPGSPANGAAYIVGASATGAWAGKDGQIAYWLTAVGAWSYLAPGTDDRWKVRVSDEDADYRWNGTAWAIDSSGGGSFTGGTLTSALNEAPATTLASASTVNVGAEPANTVIITGTTTITSLGTIASGAVRRLEFQGVLTLTHNGTSLILPTGANITTAAGDVAEFRSLGAGNWRCVSYTRASGQALVVPGGGFTGGTLSLALNEAPITTVASSGSIDIGAATSNTISISGTTTITSLGTIASGAKRELVFLGALTLTHNGTSLILPGAANIVTVAGDSAVFVSLGSGNWKCLDYRRVSGAALVAVPNPVLAGYSETLETMAGTAIDVSASNVKKKVLSGSTTFTITGAGSGACHSFTLLVEGGNTHVVTWPGSFDWLDAVPTLTAKDVITGFSIDGGTTWLVSYAGSYA